MTDAERLLWAHLRQRRLNGLRFRRQHPIERFVLERGRVRGWCEIGKLNATLSDHPYLLIGPGRWGTSDPGLGIPVDYTHISGARVIVETAMGHRQVEHSEGTHFFQNVTSRRIGYLTVSPRFDGQLDEDWLEQQPAVVQSEHVRHVRLDEPLSVHLDGRKRKALILKRPAPLRQDRDPDGDDSVPIQLDL